MTTPQQSPERTSPTASARPGAVMFIFITVLLDVMALGMVVPVLPSLVRHFVEGNTSQAAVIYGLFNAVFALVQFFCSPVLGGLSDRFGRRPLILASNLGLGLSYALMAWAPNVLWLFVGRVVSGVTSASFATASAYICDVTELDKRPGAFAILGAAYGAGFVFGPAIGGMLGDFDPRLPLYVAAAFSLANAVYGWLVLPESLPKPLRLDFSWRRANPVGALVLLRRHPELFGLAGVSFISTLAQVSLPSTIVLYAQYRYGWTLKTLGVTLTLVGVALVFAQAVIVGRFIKRFGNRRSMIAGLGFGALGFLIAGLASTGNILWWGIPVLALWGIFGAAAQTVMSKHVSCGEQGQLQGATASLTGIAELIGPMIFPFVFAYFVRPGVPMVYSGAPFILASVLLVLGGVWAWWVTRPEVDPLASED
jgi:DHA1 family tetracycline resistance protein-like MFS transporter